MADRNAIELGIGLRADDSQLAGDIARIKAKVEGTPIPAATASVQGATAEATEATKKLGEETKKVGEKSKEALGEGGLAGKLRAAKKLYGEQIEVVQGIIGKFMAVGAVAVTFYNIGKVIGEQIVDKLETAAEKANNFLMTVDRSNTKSAIEKISAQVNKLNAEIADTDSVIQQLIRGGYLDIATVGLARLFEKDRQKLIDERAKLGEALKGLSNKIADDMRKAEQEGERKRGLDHISNMEALNKISAQAMRDRMTEEEKILEEANQRKLEISAAYVKLTAEQQKAVQEQILETIKSIDEQAAARIEAIRDQQAQQRDEFIRQEQQEYEARIENFQDFADAQRKWYREQQQAADKVRNDWVKSLQDIRQEINATFGQESANSLTQFSQQLQVQTMQTVGNFNRIITEGVG